MHSADSTPPSRVIRQGLPVRHHLTRCDTGLIIRRRQDEPQQQILPTNYNRPRDMHASLSTPWGRPPAGTALNGAASSTPEQLHSSSSTRRLVRSGLAAYVCPRANQVHPRERGSKSLFFLNCLHVYECLQKLFDKTLPQPRLPLSTNQRDIVENVRYIHQVHARNPSAGTPPSNLESPESTLFHGKLLGSGRFGTWPDLDTTHLPFIDSALIGESRKR